MAGSVIMIIAICNLSLFFGLYGNGHHDVRILFTIRHVKNSKGGARKVVALSASLKEDQMTNLLGQGVKLLEVYY